MADAIENPYSAPVASSPPAESGSTFSKGFLKYALAVILIANFLNYLDRTVLSGLEKEIKERYSITEGGADGWKYGLLWTAFTVGYMLTSPVIGFMADRWRRTRIFSVCVMVWSLATVGCGLASNYWILLAMRVLIGVGEAGCLVIGPTLLSDYFPPAQRGRILATLFVGMPLGGACGYVTAGLANWHAFYWAGLPGVPIAFALWFLAEPRRGASEAGGGHAHPKNDLKSYLGLFKIKTLRYIVLAQAFAAFTLVPLMHFGIMYFEELKVPKKEITMILGLLVLFGGIGGAVVGGLVGDWLHKRDKGAYAMLAGIGFLVAFPSTIGALYLAPQTACYVLLFFSFASLFMCMPLVNTQIANAVPATQRALAYAGAVFVLHILGDTLSPPLFGVISSKLGTNGRLTTFMAFSCSLLLSAFFCALAWRAAQGEVQPSAGGTALTPEPGTQPL
jgi:MFS family permease